MSSSTERRLALAVVAAGALVLAATVELAGTIDWLDLVLTASAITIAAVAVDRSRAALHAERRAARERGALFDHMLRAIDAERQALAHRLHDGPQQSLTAVRLMCDAALEAVGRGDEARAREVLERLEQLAADSADDLRRTVGRLHPVVMQQLGLVQALGSLAETVHEEYGVATAFERPHDGWDAEAERDTAIFQIAREAAVNAARYGRPPVTIGLTRSPADICLSVEDRGGGLPEEADPGIGIRMMRERAARIGAQLDLETEPGVRTRVRLRVPVRT
jgi:two-component system, NarL family, sensor kinase